MVSLGSGRWAPEHLRATVDDPARPKYLVHIRWVRAEDDYRCVEIGFTSRKGDALSGSGLSVPVASVLRDALQTACSGGPVAPAGTWDSDLPPGAGAFWPVGMQPAAARQAAGLLERKRPKRYLTPEHLAEVAAVYREAVVTGKPVLAVKEKWGTSPGTARRWVQEARAAGFLRPAKPRRAGEIEPEGKQVKRATAKPPRKGKRS